MSGTLIPARPEPGVYKIRSLIAAVYITLESSEGKKLNLWAAGSKETGQQWQVAHLGNGEYSLISYTTGLVVSAANGHRQQAKAEFQPPSDSTGRWTFEARDTPDSGNYLIRNVGDPSLVIDLADNHTNDGTPILAFTQNKPLTKNQTWNLAPV